MANNKVGTVTIDINDYDSMCEQIKKLEKDLELKSAMLSCVMVDLSQMGYELYFNYGSIESEIRKV